MGHVTEACRSNERVIDLARAIPGAEYGIEPSVVVGTCGLFCTTAACRNGLHSTETGTLQPIASSAVEGGFCG